ncbi:MAG TPA: hypothetical protein VKV74_19240 [Bryobacteraceae bacterium]|nr:hypothetical protein [Bryobacteraceae bacterium]
MIRLIAALIAIAALSRASDVLGPYSASTNHSDDIAGAPDTFPGNWGTRGSNVHTMTFTPPAGYVTRILRVYGNFQGWMRNPPANRRCSGVLWGLRSNADDASPMSYGSANTMLYIQDASCGDPFRDTVDVKIENGLLPDNALNSVVAVFLNDTGSPVHMESSFTVVYQFEPEGRMGKRRPADDARMGTGSGTDR